MARETARLTAAAFLLTAALPACDGGSDTTGPGPDPTISLTSPFDRVVAVPDSDRSITVTAVDEAGMAVPGVALTFTAPPGHGTVTGVGSVPATTNAAGAATVVWALAGPGEYRLDVQVVNDDTPGPENSLTIPAVIRSHGSAVDEMLRPLDHQIELSIKQLRQLSGLNPGVQDVIGDRIEVLEQPNLASAIVDEERFRARAVPSRDGRSLPVIAVFPAEPMRAGADRATAVVGDALAAIEAFFRLPYRAERIRIWYGFGIGSRGGAGMLSLEDRATYEARASGRVPWEAIVHHEVGHGFLGHESATQFLELLSYNHAGTGSTSLDDWVFTRDYSGPRDDNTGVHALLDIYGLIGYDRMADAYRAIYELRPPYGQTLCEACRQAFVDAAPPELKEQVAAKVEHVGT